MSESEESARTATSPKPATEERGSPQEQSEARRREKPRASNMLPGRERRTLGVERFLVRLVATAGIVGIGVVLGAILASSNVQGWIIGLVVAGVSVILSAILWSSRQL
jgi:hypothetical protein